MRALVVLATLVTSGALPDGGTPAALGPKDLAATWAHALLAGDLDALTAFCAAGPGGFLGGFSFDGRQVWSESELRAEWLRALERRPLAGVALRGVELSTTEEFIRLHGKPPARLASLNLIRAVIATVDLGGRAVLLFFKQRGGVWVPIGVSD